MQTFLIILFFVLIIIPVLMWLVAIWQRMGRGYWTRKLVIVASAVLAVCVIADIGLLTGMLINAK